jgi:hypothetical protein
LTIDDEGVFTTPWSAVITYGRPLGGKCLRREHATNTTPKRTLRSRQPTGPISESWRGPRN